jgi:head-tail adaptor
MRLPHLRRRLLLEVTERLPDGAGGFTEGWLTLGELWAEVTPLDLRATQIDGATLARQSHRIVIRATPPGSAMRPRPAQRLRDGQGIFTILSVTARDPGGRFLTCLTREDLPQ